LPNENNKDHKIKFMIRADDARAGSKVFRMDRSLRWKKCAGGLWGNKRRNVREIIVLKRIPGDRDKWYLPHGRGLPIDQQSAHHDRRASEFGSWWLWRHL